MHIATLKFPTTIPIHLFRASQVKDNPTPATLQWNKAPTKILAKYFDYTDVFSFDLAIELPKNTGMNEHTIKLIDGKQPPYGPIYALSLVELETLKTYIKTYLKTRFIRPFKSLIDAPILFDRKLDGSLRLCVDYQDFNNIIIKN